jgi:hypothetical protein
MTGYNFVRGRALVELQASYQNEKRFAAPRPHVLSAVSFLRHLERQEKLPHACLQVEGFEQLWAKVEDAEALAARIKKLLSRRANWLQQQEEGPFIYFRLPEDVAFSVDQHVNLRLPDGRLVDLDLVVGHPTEVSPDHYHRVLAVDS